MISDQAQRSQAIDPAASFIVQAPAGSGKTELLIQRFLRLLTLVDSPEEIVAITFTRKAAAEMQGRVLVAITKAFENVSAESEHETITLELAKQVLERDKNKSWNIIENPVRLRIQTIDSLCANLNRQMPLLANLGTQPETIEEPKLLFDQAVTKALKHLDSDNRWSDSIARLLIHLDNDLPRLKRLLIEMLAKRDQWLRYVSAKHDRDDMESTLKRVITEHLSKLSKLLPKQFISELCVIAAYAANNLREINPDNVIASCVEMTELPGCDWIDLNRWQAIRELLLTKDGKNWRKRLDKNTGFPAASENKSEAELRKSMKTRAQAFIQAIQEVDDLKQLLNDLNNLPAAHYQDDEWEIIGAMSDILLLSEAELRLVFSERNQMDFTAVTQAAISALGGEESPTDLALYLDYQINHLLVDEYQDISFNQFQLLQSLISGWSIDEAKSVFLVGDPMQSIYRFREAEVGIFIQTWQQQHINQIELTPLRLEVNFRSSSAIVQWVNQHFQCIMPAEDNVNTGAVSFYPSTAKVLTDKKSKIDVYPMFNRSDQEESQKIVSTIQSLLTASTDESIAILVQSRAHLLQIIPALKQANIPFQAINIDPLANLACIQDLLALTRAYTHLADRIAWLAILRAPWCGVKLGSLTKLLSNNGNEIVWQVLQDDEKLELLEKEDRDRIINFRDIFQVALEGKQRKSLRQAIESLWLNLNGPATIENELELEDADLYFELLSQHDEGAELTYLINLVEATDKLFAATDSDPSIRLQIMSMHKAKGLEFDHVILPGLGRGTKNQKNELMMWSMKTEMHEQKLIMAPIKNTSAKHSDIYQYLKQIDSMKQTYENARLLYVAVTRAKKSLLLLAHANLQEDGESGEFYCQPNKRSLLNHLWANVKEIFETKLSSYILTEDMAEQVGIDQSNRRISSEFNKPEFDNYFKQTTVKIEQADIEQRIEYEWAGENIKHIGSTVHRYIQHIAEQGLENWNLEKIDQNLVGINHYLKSLGVNKKDLGWASQRVKQALINIISDKKGQWILSPRHQQAENELALTGVIENSVINIKIDRTFIDENDIRWIVDYKSSRHEESDMDDFLDQEKQRYQSQLERYAAIIRQFDDSKNKQSIRMGLYFPLLCGWREWSL